MSNGWNESWTSERASAALPLRWWMLLIPVLVAASAYGNSLLNGFAFDDVTIVRDNPHVVCFEWTAIWTDNYWPSHDGIQPDALYRPLTLWTYIANQALTPGAAWSFHLVNVLLHALVTLMLAVLTWRIFGSRAVAVLTGVLFAVHPLHTEAVSNVVGRAELLAVLWTLAALLVYLPQRPLAEETGPPRRPWWHGAIVAACFLAAILSKETPITLPAALIVIDLWRWLRWEKATRPSLFHWAGNRLLRYHVAMLVVIGGYLAARINACGLMTDTASVHPIVNLLVKATPMERIITPFALLAKYLALTFWPANLSADYSAPSIRPTDLVGNFPWFTDGRLINPSDPLALAGILLCVLGVVAAIRTWRRNPHIALVLGLFLCSYALVANFIRIGTIFGERLFYWPSAFVLMLVSWAIVKTCRACWSSAAPARTVVEATPTPAVAGRFAGVLDYASAQRSTWPAWLGRAVVIAVLTLLGGSLVGMGIRTYVRNTDWADNIPLAIATGRDNPMSAKACYWAGNVLVVADKPQFVDIGLSLLQGATELYPDFAQAYWEIAKYHGRKGELGPSIIYLAQAVRLDPGTRDTRVALAAVVHDISRVEPERYMPELEKFFAEHPDDPVAYFAMAIAYHGQGEYTLAEWYAQEALERDDRASGAAADGARDVRLQFHEAAAELAFIRFDDGRKEDAVDLFRQYVMRVRNSVEARCTMAHLLLTLDPLTHPNAIGEAEMNLARAAVLEPGNAHLREVRGELSRKKAGLASLVTDAAGPPAPHERPSFQTGGNP